MSDGHPHTASSATNTPSGVLMSGVRRVTALLLRPLFSQQIPIAEKLASFCPPAETPEVTSDYPAPQLQSLEEVAARIAQRCTGCGACVRACPFLQEYGNPRDIAQQILSGDENASRNAFECSLCSLCGATCPEKLEPLQLFLAMRRNAVQHGAISLKPFKRLISYESCGNSDAFSLFGLPENADTVFFPGCTLTGTRSQTVQAAFEHLRSVYPRIGAVLACCSKPSHDLGRQEQFNGQFGKLYRQLHSRGIKRIITACPNCHKVFANYAHDMEAVSIYEVLAQHPPQTAAQDCVDRQDAYHFPPVAMHDPCPLRTYPAIHDAARALTLRSGADIVEMPSVKSRTLCCGEGGATAAIRPDFARQWAEKRSGQANGKTVVTYCAGCTGFLSPFVQTAHVLDLAFFPVKTLGGRMKPARAPFTYLHRLRVKGRWKRKYFR
ncbi:(Fe-S)-binding protein [Oleidesulfovibrio sp.]|uniref:(Fe-S)-binding protein n=1 Tax=Oleidesulfovibrio sp. TaxID=2909707 RepID=UPI003A8B025B